MNKESIVSYLFDNGKLIGIGVKEPTTATDPPLTPLEKETIRIFNEHKQLQAENKRLKEERVSEVRHPLDVETNKPRKWRSYCYKCGTTVKNQKYCHNCGSKLLWPKD